MKRYLPILFVMTSLIICGCEVEEMKSPDYEDLGKLEVSFVYGDATLSNIRLTPAAQTIEVEARLNFENIKWKVVSDQPWCVVEKDVMHEGNGTFTISVDVNKGVDDKEAVISLCAGDYKAGLIVTQNADVFIMDQTFELGMKKSGSAEVNVKTLKGVKWSTRQPEWMHVAIEETSATEGETEYEMLVQWDENTSESRLGVVELFKEGYEAPSSQYAVWQFGDSGEYDFEADGNIRLSSKPGEAAPLEIRTPSGHIDSLKHPDWVRLEKVENDDKTTSWLLYFDSNPSDCFAHRETQLTYTVVKTGEENKLPVIYQNYYSARGLISAKGFSMFAENFNSGGDISEWMEDGVINIKEYVDLSELEGDWISIGTDERPFNLKFNGGGKQISGFSASNPLFGVCDGAEITNVALDSTCRVAVTNDFETDLYVASLAGRIENTAISDCKSAAEIELSALSVQSSSKVYTGSLVGYLGKNSSVTGSINAGSMDVNIKRTEADGQIYVGGVTGYSEGRIYDCENTGKLSDKSMSKYHYVGGITGYSTADAELDRCKNSGHIMHASDKKMNNTVCVGGIVGKNHGVLKSSGYLGSAEIITGANTVYLGGGGGIVDDISGDSNPLEKCYCTEGSISYSGLDISLSRYVRIGGLVGMLNVPLVLDCNGMTVNCDITTTSMENKGSLVAGGVIGYAKEKLTLTSPEWKGTLKFNMSPVNMTSNEVCVGGILGMSSVAELNLKKARTSGKIEVSADQNVYWKIPTAIGGVVGCASNGCTVSESINNASLEWTIYTRGSNQEGVVSTGGIVGRIDKGVAVISVCTNNGLVLNLLNHGAKWNSGSLLASRTGGIIGTYGYVKKNNQYEMDFSAFEPASSNNITITDCHTTSEVASSRGLIGGIAGYLYNATVSGCSYTGVSPNEKNVNNCNVGGIAGAVENTYIKDCTVKASLYGVAQGSCEFKAGGIAAYLYTGSSISNCRYFGHITTGDNKTSTAYYGGIAGEAEADCSITGCWYGGSIPNADNDKESVNITKDNFTNYIVGNKAITATGCSYWDGE